MLMKKICFLAIFGLLVTTLVLPEFVSAQMPDFVFPDSSGNSVKILSISPDSTESLNVGDTVEIEVEIEYEIENLPATIGLNIQKGEMTGSGFDSIIASRIEVLNENKGIITLKQSIKVPNTGSIQVFTPVMSEGGTTTNTADMRSYKVLGFDEGETSSFSGFPSGSSSVKILSLSPDSSVPLYVGDTVEIEVEIEYEAEKSPVTIALNIQKGEMMGGGLDSVIATKMEVVTDKKGTITITQPIVVPETASIQVLTPLMLEGGAHTTTVDMRVYQVLKR